VETPFKIIFITTVCLKIVIDNNNGKQGGLERLSSFQALHCAVAKTTATKLLHFLLLKKKKENRKREQELLRFLLHIQDMK
jgi:hypothetical protein